VRRSSVDGYVQGNRIEQDSISQLCNIDQYDSCLMPESATATMTEEATSNVFENFRSMCRNFVILRTFTANRRRMVQIISLRSQWKRRRKIKTQETVAVNALLQFRRETKVHLSRLSFLDWPELRYRVSWTDDSMTLQPSRYNVIFGPGRRVPKRYCGCSCSSCCCYQFSKINVQGLLNTQRSSTKLCAHIRPDIPHRSTVSDFKINF